jgi:hypothetical protein
MAVGSLQVAAEGAITVSAFELGDLVWQYWHRACMGLVAGSLQVAAEV